jgi:hypothetical protein
MPFHHEGMVLPPGVEPGGESLGGTARSVLGAWWARCESNTHCQRQLFYRQPERPLSSDPLSTHDRIRTRTRPALNGPPLPLGYVSMVLPRGFEPPQPSFAGKVPESTGESMWHGVQRYSRAPLDTDRCQDTSESQSVLTLLQGFRRVSYPSQESNPDPNVRSVK